MYEMFKEVEDGMRGRREEGKVGLYFLEEKIDKDTVL